MKVTIENFPNDIVKINTKSFPKGLQDEIKSTLAEPNEYGITWSEYLDVSDASFLELLVSKINEAIEKDNKPKAEPKLKNKPLRVTESEKEKVKYQEWFQKVKKVEEQKLEFTDSQINKLNEFDKNHNFYENLNHLAKFTKNKTLIDAANYSLKTWVKNGSKLQSDMKMEDLILSKIKVSKINEAIEKDNKPKAEPRAKGRAKPTPQPSTTTPQPKSIYADFIKEINKVKAIKFDLTKAQQKVFDKNEDENSHSENVVYLAKLSGNKVLLKAANFSVKQRDKDEGLLKENNEFQELIRSKMKVTYFKEVAKPNPVTKPKPLPESRLVIKSEDKKEKEAIAKKEIVKEKLEKEVKELLAKVKANAKLKDKIVSEVKTYLNANGLAGKPDKKPLTLDEKIKMLKDKKHFYANLLSGDKADFKAIGKRIGLSYRTSTPKKK